ITHMFDVASVYLIQTSDRYMVDIYGKYVQYYGTTIETAMRENTQSVDVHGAQKESLDRILENHELYCTVCDFNNGDCTIHNTVAEFGLEHQSRPFTPKPYEEDHSSHFNRYNPD